MFPFSYYSIEGNFLRLCVLYLDLENKFWYRKRGEVNAGKKGS